MIITCFILAVAAAFALGYVVFLKRKLFAYETILNKLIEEKLQTILEEDEEEERL